MNKFTIVGKLAFIDNCFNKNLNAYGIGIKIPNPDKNSNERDFVIINCWINKDIHKNIKTFKITNNIVGIKGYITCKEQRTQLYVNKITFLEER